MKKGAIDHPKVLDLQDRLDVPRYVAVGILETLWHWCGQYTPAGNVGKYSNRSIARAIDWPAADADRLVTALVESHWLDEDEAHRLVVHDWPEHADDVVHMRLAKMRGFFIDGTPPKTSRFHSVDREIIRKWYTENTEPQNYSAAMGTPKESPALSGGKAESLKPKAESLKPKAEFRGRAREASPGDGPLAATIAEALGNLGGFSANGILERIQAVANDSGPWRAWWRSALKAIEQADGGLAMLEQAVHYVEDCANPATRRAKDLGELRNPGGFLVAEVLKWARGTGVKLPTTPQSAARAN